MLGRICGMGGDDVHRLHERLLGDLPVAAQHLRHVDLDEAVLERPPGEVVVELADVLRQRRRRRVGVDEHEPAPGRDLHLAQAPVGRILDLREVPRARDVQQRPVDLPAEAVERAAELRRPAAALGPQQAAAVQAHVVERLDRARAAAHDEVRAAGDVVDQVVADVGEVLLAAGHLPGAVPHLRPFELEELG